MRRWRRCKAACSASGSAALAAELADDAVRAVRAPVALLAVAAALVLCVAPRPAAAATAPAAASVRPAPQQDPQLRPIVQQAIRQAQCFADRYDSAVWYTLMEPKLQPFVSDGAERLQILKTVYCETHRPGASLLPPGLVMAMLEVESRFDRWAVSSAGAVGLMQVMPFWPERLGMHRYELTRVVPNIHMGCAILRFYLDAEHRDIRRALERYNGSFGHRDYADRVITRWTTYWNGADALGRAPLKAAAAPTTTR